MTNLAEIELDETDVIDVAFVSPVRGISNTELTALNIRPEGAVVRWVLDETTTPDLQFTAFVPWSNIKYLSQFKELSS